jgi:hypothetical protein
VSRRALAFLALGAFVSAPARAQTSDPVFAGWRWTPDALGSRPAGLGGAFVAVADTNQAAYANPAGLMSIPAWELGASSNRTWLGVAGGRMRWLRVAAYVANTEEARVEFGGEAPHPGTFLDSSVWEVGLGVAAQPAKRLKLGVSLAWSRLRLEGQRTRTGPDGQQTVATNVAGEDTRARVSAGLLLALAGTERRSLPSLRLGLAYQPGFDWSARIDDDAGSRAIAVRRPTLVMAGLAFRPGDRWLFTVQGDLALNREVVAALQRNDAGGTGSFRLDDTVEPRLGSEFSAPLWCGCGIVRLRGGLAFRPPGTLSYEGSDPALSAEFRGEDWRTVGSLGASFVTEHFGNAVRVDVDALDLFHDPGLSFGIVWRF